MHDPILIASMLITLVPFAAFVLIMVFTRANPRVSAALSIAAVTVSLLCALFLIATRWKMELPLQFTFRWVVSGDIQIPFGYLLDPASLLMLVAQSQPLFLD